MDDKTLDEEALDEFKERFGDFMGYNNKGKLVTSEMIHDWLKYEVGKEQDDK